MPVPKINARLLAMLHRSALDDQYLQPFLDMCSTITDTHTVALLLQDLVTPSKSLMISNADGTEPSDLYANFAGENVFLETALPHLKTGKVIRTNTLMHESTFRKTHFYSEYCLNTNIHHSMGATIEFGQNSVVALTLSRQRAAPFRRQEQRWAEELMPHLLIWLETRNRINGLGLSIQAAWETLNMLNFGVVIYGCMLKPVFVNTVAKRLIANSRTLRWKSGHIDSAHPHLSNWLQHMVARLCTPSVVKAPGGSMNVENEKEHLHLMVAPLAIESQVGENRLCALFISNIRQQPSSLEHNLEMLYNLTPRETEIACLRIEGHTLKNIAGLLKVKESTIQTHIKHIHNKTGAQRQSDLIRLGLSLQINMR